MLCSHCSIIFILTLLHSDQICCYTCILTTVSYTEVKHVQAHQFNKPQVCWIENAWFVMPVSYFQQFEVCRKQFFTDIYWFVFTARTDRCLEPKIWWFSCQQWWWAMSGGQTDCVILAHACRIIIITLNPRCLSTKIDHIIKSAR